MKIYHSFWENGWNGKLNDTLYNMHKLSVLTALRSYGNIHLITTEKGRDFLSDLPYTSIELFEDTPPIELNDVWSISKIHAYKQICKKNDPFFHIDYDVFLFNRMPEWFEQAEVVFQHIEDKQSMPYYELKYIFERCKNTFLAKKNRNFALNMGIFGGNNIKAIEFYTDECFKIVYNKYNFQNYWAYKDLPIPYGSKAVALEQWYITFCLDHMKVTPTALLRGNELKMDEKSREYGYCHVWGAKHSDQVHDLIKYKINEIESQITHNDKMELY